MHGTVDTGKPRPRRRARRVRTSAAGVRATWWYTAGSALGLTILVLLVFALRLLSDPTAGWMSATMYAVGAVGWFSAFVLVGREYRDTAPQERVLMTTQRALLLVGGTLAAALAAFGVHSPALGVSLAATMLCVLPWPRGVRGRITGLCTVVIIAVAWIELLGVSDAVSADPRGGIFASLLFVVLLPVTVVSMLWWWDIVHELDVARVNEGRLAAAQERLRLANDVHDLQGHHLQVIALQLELAERLLDTDVAAAAVQVRAARSSVDEARAGTRSLATRFRGVPLPDEIANAADLLRAGGIDVRVEVAPDATGAPADVLGPIVRESTTNVLKHGGGRTARLTLVREDDVWRFTAQNDVDRASAVATVGDGTGVVGMTHRAEAAGGTVEVRRDSSQFVLDVRIPDGGRP